MRLAHNVKVSVYCKQGEDGRIKEMLMGLMPFDLEEEKIAINESLVRGEKTHERDIIIYEILLTKERHVKAFLESLNEKLNTEQKELLIRQSSLRFDREFNFFLRLDKDKLQEQRYWITDSGNCYHIRISIAAYPKNQEKALEALKGIFH